MSNDPDDFYKALEDLDALDLPFEMSMASQEDDRIEIHVASNEVDQAVSYFEEHPFTLANGNALPVEVVGLAGSWISEPIDSWDGDPAPLPLAELVGLDAREAAQRANLSGWLVRAHEPGAPLTADYVSNRLNLCYSTTGIVTDANIG